VRPSTDARFAGRVLSSTLPLQLYTIDERGSKQPAGSTAGARSAKVPEGETWPNPAQIHPPPRRTGDGAWIDEGDEDPGLGESRQVTDAASGADRRDLEHVTYSTCKVARDSPMRGFDISLAFPDCDTSISGSPNITDRGLEVLRQLPELQGSSSAIKAT
jgi:hypothetical protein